jgi:hypothetical protein
MQKVKWYDRFEILAVMKENTVVSWPLLCGVSLLLFSVLRTHLVAVLSLATVILVRFS